MLMTKGFDSKILYTILIAVSGIALTLGAASALVTFAENIQVDNGTGTSSVKVTSGTGHSRIILEDQGKRTFVVQATNNAKKFEIIDISTSYQPRISINQKGDVGIGVFWPQAKLDVKGDIHTNSNVNVDGNLNVGGGITGDYITNLEATITTLQATITNLEATNVDHEARLALLEGTTVPMVAANEGMITTNGAMISNNAGNITLNQADIASNAADIVDLESGNPPPQGNPCNPDGDGAITAQEMYDYWDSQGIITTQTVPLLQGFINSLEIGNAGTNPNGVLDNPVEVNIWNGNYHIPLGIPTCAFP